MEYTKNLMMALLAIVAMYAMWVFTMSIGPFIKLRFLSVGWHAILCVALLAVSGIWSSVAKGRWTLLASGLTFGAALGTLFSISYWYHDFLVDARGFWKCALLCLINVMILVVCGAALTGSCIQLVLNVFKLNFLPVLLCFMLGVTAFFAGMMVFAGAFECHAFMGVMTIIGATGGGVAGVGAKNLDPDFVTDANGNMHFVVQKQGDEVLTTDGERMRRRADGNFE